MEGGAAPGTSVGIEDNNEEDSELPSVGNVGNGTETDIGTETHGGNGVNLANSSWVNARHIVCHSNRAASLQEAARRHGTSFSGPWSTTKKCLTKLQ